MSYKLFRGEFHLFYQGKTKQIGSEPDGDTIWFQPNNKKLLENFTPVGPDGRPRKAQFNGSNVMVPLRFEGIDSIELHYQGTQQEDILARAARDFMLKEAGFKLVTYSGAKLTVVKTATPHPMKGYILTRSIDPHGRIVSFVFAGTTNRPDGSDVFLDTTMLKTSLNAKITAAGHAYPLFYRDLPVDLRNQILTSVKQARNASPKRGLWPKDTSTTGATVKDLAGLQKLVLWPKLFRRLSDYFRDPSKPTSLALFDTWLKAKPADRDDELWIASIAAAQHLHNVVKVTGNKISLKYATEDLIIIPR